MEETRGHGDGRMCPSGLRSLFIDEMFGIVQRQISLQLGDTADICKNIHWLLLCFSRSTLNLSIDCIKKLSKEFQRMRCCGGLMLVLRIQTFYSQTI